MLIRKTQELIVEDDVPKSIKHLIDNLLNLSKQGKIKTK